MRKWSGQNPARKEVERGRFDSEEFACSGEDCELKRKGVENDVFCIFGRGEGYMLG